MSSSTDSNVAALASAELPLALCEQLLFIDTQGFQPAMANALKSIGTHLNVSRCSLFLFETEGNRVTLASQWCARGVQANPSELVNADASQHYPWLLSKLLERKPVKLTSLSELPPEATTDRAVLRAQRVRSLLLLPIFIGDQPLGALGVDSTDSHRVWSRQDLILLQSVRDLLTHALLRHRAELRAGETERHYQRLIEYSQAIVYALDRDGRYTFVSPSVTDLTGYRSAELIGQHYSEFVHAQDIQRLLPMIRSCMVEGKPTPPMEYRINARDGRTHWHRSVMVPIRNREGRLEKVVANALDVTDLHREGELRELLLHLANRFINLPLDQHDKGVNAALARIGRFVNADRTYVFRYDFDTGSACNTFEWCAEGVSVQIDQLQSVDLDTMPDWLGAHRAGKPVMIEDVATHPEEGLRDLLLGQGIRSLLSVPLMQAGACIGFVGFDSVRQRRSYSPNDIRLLKVFAEILVNLHKRHETQRHLGELAQRLGQIIDGTHAGTWEWNQLTREIVFNQRWTDMLGYASVDDLPNDSLEWMQWVHPDDLLPALERLKVHLKGATRHHESEIRVRHAEGHYIWLMLRGQVASRTIDGRAELISGIALDITERKLAAERLRESEHRFRHLLEDVPGLAVQGFDTDLKIRFWNRSSERLYGWKAEQVLGRSLLELTVPQDQHRAYVDNIQALISGQQSHWSQEMTLLDRNGEAVAVYASHVVQKDTRGGLDLFRIDIDQRDKKAAQDRLKLAASVFSHSHEGILITDDSGNILEVNEAFTTITGYERSEAIGRNPRFLQSGRQDDAFYQTMWEALQRDGTWSGEVWNRRKTGEFYAENLTISAVRDGTGRIIRYVGLFFDITHQKEYQQHLERVAHFDVLTDLPNRTLLADRLRQALARASRGNQEVVVAYIDLDEFKSVNDHFGHAVGDECLRQIGARLEKAVRSGDTVARLGGDEFVLVLADIGNRETALKLLERLLDIVAAPCQVDDVAISLTVSIGATFFPQARALEADQLLRQADQAMYEAKSKGRNRIHFFDAEMEQAHANRLALIGQLRRALADDEFILHYQPKVDLSDGRVEGFEGLIRWQHPERGLLSPAAFLPALEGDELAHAVGHWVIEQALTDLAGWRASGLDLELSINVSAQQLLRTGFTEALAERLGRHPEIEKGRLTLEFLETGILEDIDTGREVTRNCHRLGANFALDDFGTGFSSLSHLKHLPLKQIKIDRSFVTGMLEDPEDLAIIEGVINLGRAFDLDVLAEGVENVDQATGLIQLGCQKIQGYLVARPMPPEQVEDWVRQWQGMPELAAVAPLSRELIPVLFGRAELAMRLDKLQRGMNPGEALDLQETGSRGRFERWLETALRNGAPTDASELLLIYQDLLAEQNAFEQARAAGQDARMHQHAEVFAELARNLSGQLQDLLPTGRLQGKSIG
ncbi:MAG: PAS domain S-box protein [Wenzhouxiangella sp.]|nr:MAG: PAS domain S-box protein [Wenzhouxiangella sp.]